PRGSGVIEVAGRTRITERGAQASRRYVGARRQEHHRRPRGALDAAAAPGPQTDNCPEQERSRRPAFSGDEDSLTGCEIDVPLAQLDRTGGRCDLQIIEADCGAVGLLQIDAAGALT